MELSHSVFQGPFPVQLDHTTIPKPESYDHYHQDPKLPERMPAWTVHGPVEVPGERGGAYGSVSVRAGLEDTPDAEFISAGVNTKGPGWAAIARQGNFLKWGFAAGPSEMTESGRDVFANCIAYIAQFDGERPIAPRRYIGRDWWLDQAVMLRDIATEHARLKGLMEERNSPPDAPWAVGTLEDFTEKTVRRQFPAEICDELGTDIEAYEAALVANRGYLYVESGREFAGPKLDVDAKAYGIPNHSAALLEHCIGLLEAQQDVERATRVLTRYTGLAFASAKEWRAWLEEVRGGLYFSDTAGYRFFSTVPSPAALAAEALALPMAETSEEKPVTFGVQLVRTPGRAKSATLVVRVDVERGWHIYAKAGADSPYLQTSLTLDLPDGVERVGEWRLPAGHPSPKEADVELWEGQLVFQCELVAEAASDWSADSAVEIAYQVCDANFCLPPDRIRMQIAEGADER